VSKTHIHARTHTHKYTRTYAHTHKHTHLNTHIFSSAGEKEEETEGEGEREGDANFHRVLELPENALVGRVQRKLSYQGWGRRGGGGETEKQAAKDNWQKSHTFWQLWLVRGFRCVVLDGCGGFW